VDSSRVRDADRGMRGIKFVRSVLIIHSINARLN
jgi:hypothetical protein